MFGDLAIYLLIGFNFLIFFYFVLLNSFYLGTSIFSFRALRKYSRRLNSLDVDELVRTAGAPPVTVVMPAYNEEASCVEAVNALFSLHYPEFEIVVVNDGSTDDTLAQLSDAFQLTPAIRAFTADLPTAPIREIYRSRTRPNLWVVDKENGGKSDALNAGLNCAHSPLFCAMDADSILEREALMRLVRPFLEDGTTVAAGGIIRVVNGCTVERGKVGEIRLPRSLLAQFQVVEYLRAFLAGRMGWAALDVLLIVSGAFGLFRRSAVVAVGGFASDTVGEDMELVVRLHRYFRELKKPYRITFVPDPVAWTEAPETARTLGRQRDRWQRGLIESLSRHRNMLFNPKYGRIGYVAFPYFWFLEGFGPIVELFGYVAFAVAVLFGLVSMPFVVAFLVLAFVFGIALSVAAVALEELVFRRYTRFRDFARLLLLAVFENIGYRQLLAFWRTQGVLSALTRKKGWGRMERKGFAPGRAPKVRPSMTELPGQVRVSVAETAGAMGVSEAAGAGEPAVG